MKNIILSLQIILSLLLIIFILLQVRGTGFARSWGGSTSFTRRGLEKIVFRLTFILSALFLIISIVSVAY